MKIVLNWRGPFLPTEFLESASPEAEAGVYIWVAELAGERWVEYVGKATGRPTLWRRQQEHVANTIGLRYTIPGAVRSTGVEWIPNTYPKNKKDLLDDERRGQLVKEALSYLNSIEIFLASLPDLDSKTLGFVERNLLWALQPRSTSLGTKSPPPVPLDIEHRSASWLNGNFKNNFELVPSAVLQCAAPVT